MTDSDQMVGEIVHLAGADITWRGQYLRQRCVWCGYALIDLDLTMIARPIEDADRPIATWPVGAFVAIVDSGGFRGSRIIDADPEEPGKVPEGSCFDLPPDLTREVP